jgi:hypothetical protein
MLSVLWVGLKDKSCGNELSIHEWPKWSLQSVLNIVYLRYELYMNKSYALQFNLAHVSRILKFFE